MSSALPPASISGGATNAGVTPSAQDLALLPHDDRGPSINVAIWLVTALATVFLGLRVFCKWTRKHRLFWDDCILIASYVCLLIDAILSTISIGMGFGRHQYDIDIGAANTLATFGLCSVTFTMVSQAWSKTSFAVTLQRISDGWIRWGMIFAFVSLNALFGLGALFFWVQCAPLESAWHPLVPGRCWNPRVNVAYGTFVSAYSGILNLVFCALSWRVVLNLKLKKEMAGVGLAMTLGVFAAIAAFVRCSKIHALLSGDFTYDGINLVLWGTVETVATIMAASVPAMRVLFPDIASPDRYVTGISKESKYGSSATFKSDGSSKLSSVASRSYNTTTTISSSRTHLQPPPRSPGKTPTRPPSRPPTRPPLVSKNPNKSWLADQGDSGGSEQSILGKSGPPYAESSASREGSSMSRIVTKREKSVKWSIDGKTQYGLDLETA